MPFLQRHRLDRSAETQGGTGLHLDKDQGRALAGDNFHLGETGAVVAGQDAVALFLQMAGGSLFADAAACRRCPPFAYPMPDSASLGWTCTYSRTPLKLRRCSGQGPCAAMASRCSLVG